nr:hypothetical protein [uncultured bacterium]
MKFRGGVLTALLACVFAANIGTARAADPAIKIGVLDEVKLGEGYTKYRSEMEDLDRRAKAVQTQVVSRRFLNPAEGTRFDELAKKHACRLKIQNLQLWLKPAMTAFPATPR